MGWFTSDTPKPKKSEDGGYIPPDRSSRAQCWEARDEFFRCLDRNNIIDSIKEGPKAGKECALELKEFERNCASSWVTYFKKKRVVDVKKEETLRQLAAEGATGLTGMDETPGR